MPLFTVGARLWLTKGEYAYQQGSLKSFSFTLRDGQNGRVLLGAAEGGYGPLSWVVSVGEPTVTCSQSSANSCFRDETIAFASAAVMGDAPVVVQTDQVATVMLQGMPYDVRLLAEIATATFTCPAYVLANEVMIDLRAQNLAETSLSAGLPTAAGDGG
jgi:hypothetical protein